MDLPRRFVTHVRASGALRPADRVVVACSGGADSTALLLLLVRTRRALALAEVSVAHLDHGLRPDAADDARWVADLAARLGVPARIERRRVRRRRGESPEEAARRVRYGFLAEVAAADGAVVATAHQRDDQAETVLYRALRGAGIEGLRGILPEITLPGSGVRVVRPLLPFRRDALRRWLREAGAAWREDPTNVAGNDRARLRNEILPAIRRVLRRDPVPPLARLADWARAAGDRPGTDGSRAGGPAAVVPSSRRAPGSASARRRRSARSDGAETLTWETVPASNAAFLERLRAAPGTVELIDAAAVRGDVSVRRPRPGDRFHALGLPAPQRLGHYLQRRGVPASDRALVPLLCDDEGVLCVGGHGIARRAALGNDTSRIVVIRLVRERRS